MTLGSDAQFIITVGTVIGVYLWLRHDIVQLNSRIDYLDKKFDKLNDNYAALRESLGWIRGRMGFTDQTQPNAE
ncbi:MAG: hypothetical protein OXG85_08585 [Chloroflexi bacterium]|nr:hypothetical protein [Chloroflexota bacterium]